MKNELSPEQKQYLQERKFEIIEGRPSQEEPFPYVTLREPQQWIEQSEVSYRQTPSSSTGTMGVAHPSTMGEDELVELIENMVGENMSLDGKLFNTKPGTPIKVYVIDPAWKAVAQKLDSKYK